MNPYSDRPNVIPWPPFVFLAALAAANVLTRILPLALPGPSAVLVPIGWLLVAASLGFMLWAFLAFRQHRTSVLPNRGAAALITVAPFSISRNPIYLSEAVLLFGLGLVNASLWYGLVIVPFMLAVTRLAILREEAHLAARFGSQWAAYASRVRRWV